MENYHVYGLGNALVDYEVEVENDYLKKMNVEKGLMILVDEKRQLELSQQLGAIGHKRSCGGSAANSLIAVSQLGGKGFYSCKVSNDETGRFYLKDLMSHGLETNLKEDSLPKGTTGKCLIFITPDADRSMNTFLGITQSFGVEQIDEQAIAKSQYIYIEGYLVCSPTGLEAAMKAKEIAKKNNVKIALTLSDPGVVEHFHSGFEQIIGDGIDLIFSNQQEAYKFTKSTSDTEAFKSLRNYASQFAITLGPKGALLYDGEKEIDIVAPMVEAVDTNGAGDLFAGSFLYAITNGKSFSVAGKLACTLASELTTHFGARLPDETVKKISAKLL